MSDHAPVELLSGYLDHELAERQRRRVEGHLERCPDCRRRLDGLRRVVAGLEGLETHAPPAFLGARVIGSLEAPRAEGGLRGRLQARLGRVPIQPTLFSAFATVFALALILYLLAGLFARGTDPARPLPESPPAGRLEAPAEPLPARRLDGRVFVRDGDLWIERGTETEAPVRRYGAGGEPPPAELEPYRALGRVRLRHAGRVVEVSFPPLPE